MAKKRRRNPKQPERPSSADPPATGITAPPSAGRKRRTAMASARPHGGAAAMPPPEEPRFWFGFEVPWGKLVAARFIIFSLFAIDAVMQVAHAPRYGAGGFNVAQLPLLDHLGAGRIGYAVGQLTEAVLLAAAALGVATRIAVPLAAATYAWLYFGSQLDSYQHHYLVALLLVIASFVPWEPATRGPVRSWALRLLLVQLGIMYLWAAISKLDAAWLDGRTLGSQITGTMRTLIDRTVGISAASKLVVFAELTLAATIWNRWTWIIAAPLGIAFHIGIIASGLEIGLFAWLMLALYVLVLPDRLWRRFDRWPALRATDAPARPLAAVALVGIGLACALLARLPFVTWVAVGGLAGLAGLAVMRRSLPLRPAAAYLYAFALILAVDRASSVATEYYVRWGSAERRFGDVASAEVAYRRLVAIEPEAERAHFQLARVLLQRDQPEAGIAELHEAQRLEPSLPRAYIEEARWLAAHGKRAAALDKAREATYAAPGDPTARDLVDTLSGKRPAARPAPADDPEAP